jgi:hypothetical protein
MPTPTEILNAIQTMGVERMWEDRKTPNFVSSFNAQFGGRTQPYPRGTYCGIRGGRGRCDIVVARLWIEAKFFWTFKDWPGGHLPNRVFMKHLLTDRHESALVDVSRKLPTLIGHPDVERIGFILVGFDSSPQPFDESLIERLKEHGGLSADRWTPHPLPPWENPDQSVVGGRIRAYYWERSASPSPCAPSTESPSGLSMKKSSWITIDDRWLTSREK